MTINAAISATSGSVANAFAVNRAVLATNGEGRAVPDAGAPQAAGAAKTTNDNARNDGARNDAAKADKTAAASVNPTFKYNTEAQRMVMVMRDQKSGAVVLQVPSEVALKQYEQAVKRVREEVSAQHQQGAPAGQNQTSTVTSLEAASLGIHIPLSGTDSGSDSGGSGSSHTGGSASNAGSGGSTGSTDKPQAGGSASAGSGAAHCNTVV